LGGPANPGLGHRKTDTTMSVYQVSVHFKELKCYTISLYADGFRRDYPGK
jgi:hypothetical protein